MMVKRENLINYWKCVCYDGNYYLKVPIDNNDYVYIKYIEHADGSMEFESIDEKNAIL